MMTKEGRTEKDSALLGVRESDNQSRMSHVTVSRSNSPSERANFRLRLEDLVFSCHPSSRIITLLWRESIITQCHMIENERPNDGQAGTPKVSSCGRKTIGGVAGAVSRSHPPPDSLPARLRQQSSSE